MEGGSAALIHAHTHPEQYLRAIHHHTHLHQDAPQLASALLAIGPSIQQPIPAQASGVRLPPTRRYPRKHNGPGLLYLWIKSRYLMCEYHLAHEREGIDLVEFKQYYLLCPWSTTSIANEVYLLSPMQYYSFFWVTWKNVCIVYCNIAHAVLLLFLTLLIVTFEKQNQKPQLYGASGRIFMLLGVLPDSNSCFTELLHSHFIPLLNDFTIQEKRSYPIKTMLLTDEPLFWWRSL